MTSARISVRLQPRAGRDEIVGEREGRLVVRVTASPVEGQANEALRRLVAKKLGVARSRVRLVRGARSRDKVLEVDGLAEAAARERLTP